MWLSYLLCEALRPFMRRLPRGGYRLYRLAGGPRPDERWKTVPRRYRVLYDRAMDAWYHVDMSDWMGRQHFYCGTFNLPNRLLITALLRSGDTYIDIGANQGVLTLQASRAVGSKGKVYAFEPNPEAFEILKAHLAINHRSNCVIHNLGLSSEAGDLTLSLAEEHTGTGTLRAVENPVQTMRVEVRRGDSLVRPEDLKGRVLVKIDTEGYEYHAAQGLGWLLDRVDTVFSVEVTDVWLRELGVSAAGLFSLFVDKGYRAYRLSLRSAGVGWRVGLTALKDAPAFKQCDVVFARPETRLPLE